MTKSKITLQNLLNNSNEDMTISEEEKDWDQMKPVGKEYGSQPEQSNLVAMENINAKASVETLLKIVNAYKELGTNLECCDLANELGVILGEQCPDKGYLLRDFVSGFKHGVELSGSTTANERVSALHQSIDKMGKFR